MSAVALCAAALAGATPGTCAPIKDSWQATATVDDRRRLSQWRAAFVKGLDEAKAGGHADAVTREGVLLQPDAALPDPAVPVGDYKCRTLKLGSQGGTGLGYVAYPAFDCRVSNGAATLRLAKLNGSQRPVGRVFPPEDRRQVFVGTLALGDETRPIVYGRDLERNMIGAIERIGPRRWRLVLPYPRFESTLDVIELVPAS